jgi:ADP-ribose pyrophosphatase
MNLAERITFTEKIYEGTFISLEKAEVLLGNGKKSSRDIVRHPGACAVVALDAENNIILEKQYRTPVGMVITEIPAGKLDPGEEPLTCAKRELEEETGYTAESFTLLTSLMPSPAICDEIIHIYLAENLSEGKTDPDEDEQLLIEKIPLLKAKKAVLDGVINDGKSIAGILLACAVKGI